MNLVKSIYFVIMLAILTLSHTMSVLVTSFFYRYILRKPYPTEIGHRIGINWGRSVMALTPGWHVDISGQENIPPGLSPFILVANHESTADIFAMFLLGTQFKWIAKAELFKFPLLGHAMKAIGYIPVKRGDKHGHQQALRQCAEWIQK